MIHEQQSTSHELIRKRAKALASVRSFMSERDVFEVDTPLLQSYPPIDPYIEILEISSGGYLHSSPEYGMKTLLSQGAPDIYQLSHVFRKGEVSRKHRQEFTMLEWYRVGKSLSFLIEETLSLLECFAGKHAVVRMTYEEALFKATGKKIADAHDLDYIWAFEVEPTLQKDVFVVITDFPKQMAALAKVDGDTAQRFEIHFGGYELANGYDELQTKEEYAERLESNNAQREVPLPMHDEFLRSLKKPLPPCVGVAVGFDRLLMLRENVCDIQAVTY